MTAYEQMIGIAGVATLHCRMVTRLAKRLGMTPSAVSYAVAQGEVIAADSNYELAE